MDINRDASDKHKGITLQKLRAIKLALDTIIINPKAQFHVAIESDGDVFIYSNNRRLIEENKNYESKNFSFFSKQILNTLVYFLDYWLKESVNKSENIIYSFYSTNSISKENYTKKIKSLGIDALPKEPILLLLQSKSWNGENNLIEICKKAILSEYEEQYRGKNNNYTTLEKFSDNDWKQFFSQIIWNFRMPNDVDLSFEVRKSILKYGELKNIDIKGKELFIEAMLRKVLEDKQNEKDVTQRYLTDEILELICYRINNNPIDKNLFRYIDYDYKEIIKSMNFFISSFIKDKYFSVNNNHNKLPFFISRKVKYHTSEIKIKTNDLEQKNPKLLTENVIIGELNVFINDLKPVFLFGEIGSGKSSMIAQYALQENDEDNLSILIPVNYIKGKITPDFSSLFSCVDNFINSNISNKDPLFNFEFLINNRPVKLLFDGLDELGSAEAKYLIKHLKKIFNDYSDLIIVATGRPIELQSIINFNDWNCLTTIDLAENEVLEILQNEAIASGLESEIAKEDAIQRLEFLKSRSELSLLAKTPLVVCLIRNFLSENLYEETLGTLMYQILLKRLKWDEVDLKSNYPNFFNEFPEETQRENIISVIAEEIFTSESKKINDIKLKQIVTNNVLENIPFRNQVISEAILFYKNLFLQLNDNYYSFISQPLLEVCYSVKLSERINNKDFILDTNFNTWRPYTFAIAISKLKYDITQQFKDTVIKSLDDFLINENRIPIASIIVSESKNKDIAKHFVTKLSKFSFRPLRTWSKNGMWGAPDTYTPFTIADSIYLSGTKGIDWFLEEYVNPIHPISHNEDTIVRVVLGNLFYIKKFNIDDLNKQILLDAVKYHLTARTLSCQYFLPVICLVIPDEIQIEYKSVMLVQMLDDRIYSKQSKELIDIEIKKGNKHFILDAIEKIAIKDEGKNFMSLYLYLDLYEDKNHINKTIIDKIIKLSVEEDEKLLLKLLDVVSESTLESYLRFSVLNNTKISDYAAILLFNKFGERNPYLIARPILGKTQFYNHYTEERKKILNEILFGSSNEVSNFFFSFRPRSNHFKGGLMELYIYYFIKFLTNTNKIFKNDFFYIINNHPDYPILNRYSEIRNAYKNLFIKKPQYVDFLKEGTQHIDSKIRYNANCLLLACFPENSEHELESIIYSASNMDSDTYQWLGFCMKLNYDKIILENLKNKLYSFPEQSKIYLLFILYHQNISLSDEEINILLEGLLGKGSMFDVSNFLLEQKDSVKLATQAKFLPKFLNILHGDNLALAMRVAGTLLSYHYESISNYDLGKAYVYQCQNWVKELYDFDNYHSHLLEDLDFIKGFNEANDLLLKETGKDSNLLLYKKLIIEKNNLWLEFILKLTHEGEFDSDFKLELLYNWLLSLRKKEKELTEGVGVAARELLEYPAIIENYNFHNYFPYYALIADEFTEKNINNLESSLLQYRNKSELQVALLSRIGYIPAYFNEEDSKTYLSVFSKNISSTILRMEKSDIDKIFLDSEILPNSIIAYIESILFFNVYSDDELKDIAKKGKIASIVVALLIFCKNLMIDFTTILNAIDYKASYFNRSSVSNILEEALFIIKEEMLKIDDWKILYVTNIKKEINEERDKIGNNIVENFKELLSLNADIEVYYLQIFFENLLRTPYYLKLDLMYMIFDFVLNKLHESDYFTLSKEIENNIKILKNNTLTGSYKDESISLLWMFSLIAFYIDGEKRDYSVFAFLKGLESIFLVKTNRNYLNSNGEQVKITSRDLLLHSDSILQKISPNIIKSVFIEGTIYAEPEIRSLCLIFQAFAK